MSLFPLTKECFVTSVALTAVKTFGLESLEWEPEILRDAFEKTFDMGHMSQKMFDKLNCGYMLIGTDAFNATLEGFLSATTIMNNLMFDELTVPFCSLDMCAWAVFEYLQLMGDFKDGESAVEFAPEIIGYIQKTGSLNGIYKFPKYLSFADYPDDQVPDLSADPEQFEAYNQRQQNYVSDINAFVSEKQALLKDELLTLQKAGILG